MQDYKYLPQSIDQNISKYIFNKLIRLQWKNFMNLRKVYHYIPNQDIELMNEISSIGTELLKKYGLNKNIKSMFFNLYEDGQKKTPYHKDFYNADVFTLSLGSTRKFRIKNDKTKQSIGFDLKDGDSFYFTQKFNKEYKHAIMPTKKSMGKRISIVFFIS